MESKELPSNNANGVEIGTLEFQQTAPTVTGAKVAVHSKIMLFHSDNKLIMIQLTTPKQFANELLPVLEQITETVKVMDL